MGTFFISIYNFFNARKWLLWLFTLALFAVAGVLASQVKLEEDITRILPRDKKIDRLSQFLQNSKFADKLVIMVSQKDTTAQAEPDSLTATAQEFLAGLQNEQLAADIKAVQGQSDDGMIMGLVSTVQKHLPVFLEEKDYAQIDSLTAPEKIKQTVESNYNTLISPAGMVLKQVIQADPVGISWLGVKKLQALQVDDQFELYDGFVMSKDHRNILLFITPVHPPNETGKNKEFLGNLDHWIDTVQMVHKTTGISYFGATAVSVGNAMQLRQDTYLTQGITVLLLIVLIALFFRRKRAPLLVMLPVVFGAVFSVAMVYLVQGGISVIALGAGCVVLGIAVNYSLHVFNHYRHLPDIRQVIRDLAMPMTVGSFTTVGGFLCLQFVKSPMLQDVGLFAAFSLIGASLFSLIILPHLIVLGRPAQEKAPHHNIIDRLSQWRPERNKYLVGGILLLTVVFFFSAKKVTFESDMMRMNFMPEHLKKAEEQLNRLNAYTAQSVYMLSEGKDLDEALRHREQADTVLQRLIRTGAIKKVAGTGGLLLSEKEQAERIARWKAYWTPEKQQRLMQQLRAEGQVYKFKPTAFDPFEQLITKDYGVISPEKSALLEVNMINDLVTLKPQSASVSSLLKVDPARKAVVYAALEKQPGTVVIDKQYTANRLAELIKEEFNTIAWMTSLLVFFALLLSYGRIELALITFIPMLISWVWILGIMGLFGIPFNIVNIILSTFIFGLGDDYSIFTMDGLQQEYKTGSKHLPSFKSSIFFSAITTILGLGVLIFAQHPSLRSIALIAVIGISCVVVTSQVLIPFFFNFLITNRVNKGKRPPWTLWSWSKSMFAFTYYTVGAILLTVIGVILTRINFIHLEKGKKIYHWILSKFTWSLLHIMGNIKKVTINTSGEDFKKPAVIISNHQSFLDILMSTAMTPNVVLLTNQWVYNSPLFGYVVKMADYYPVAEGAEASIDKLRDRVEHGYSIVIYPEGTRSTDASIKRFHKGAFYLAEELNLDIIPVVLHGTAYTMSKGDFLLKNGTISQKILPRIKPDDTRWGDNYSTRTKLVSRYFRQEYEQMRKSIETPAWWREQLVYQYLYKGPVLEWYMRIKTKLENNYALFHELLPAKGNIMDIGCGYGFMSYMLHFLSPERTMLGVDYDEDKIATAQHCYIRNEHVRFEAADITQYQLPHQDAFVILDVLHYLQPEAQEKLIRQCLQKLNPGGVIIVRDGDADLTERHKGTRLTELFSTRLLGFNKTGNKLSFFSSSTLRSIVEKSGGTVEQIDNTKFTSNVIFIIKHSFSEQYA
ncbi:1-acyl-sn-glycerol-3-phosphate acyltransferase [Chitinophaga sp. YIM B06452]|uniref:1-acyl-sn-glycerol-3-phosphate acyltransferase n=1 Tax=Chitinophaga sp. YIM B06452 TaxID=3082158 RepID=UPI0031FED05F